MPLKKDAWVPAAIAAAVFAVFQLGAPPARFLQWDDARTLLDNPTWRGLSWESLRWMWASRHYGPWQPLSWLSWAVDFQLWGLDPEAFRRTNIALHAATAGLFYAACGRLFPRAAATALPLGAALFFALHPLRVESVLWITERRDVLSGFFSVLSVYLWLADRRRLSAAAFAGAALSKGTAVAVVPFLFIIETSVRRKGVRETLAALLAHAAVGAFAAFKNLGSLTGGDMQRLDIPLVDRILVALSGSWFYLSKTLVPVDLSPYYPLASTAQAIRLESYPGALAALLVTAACFHRRVRSWAAPVWLAYLFALAPVSGLLQNGRQAAADRYSYLACMPFAVLFGAGLQRLRLRRPGAAAGLLAGAALFLPAATLRQSSIWESDAALWARAVRITPDAYLPNSNLSVALLVAGRTDEAIPHLRAAVRLEPKDAEARANLASILARKGDHRAALDLFSEAVSLRPNDPAFAPARYNLGILLMREGRKRDGLAHVREAVRLDPSLKLPR